MVVEKRSLLTCAGIKTCIKYILICFQWAGVFNLTNLNITPENIANLSVMEKQQK